jgi:surface polysaccharide O-acyltransferase-like enzyme
MLIGLYLVLPVLRKFVQNSDNKTIIYIMTVLFLANSFIPAVNTVCKNKVIGFYLPFTNACLFYTLFGYYAFHKMKIKFKKASLWGVIAAIMVYNVVILSVYGSFSLTKGLLEYTSPTTAVLSAAIFLLLKDSSISSKITDSVSGNSFGIYLIHCIVIQVINRLLNIYPENYPLYVSIPLFFAAVFAVSYMTSAILRKIPFVKSYIL